MFRFHKGYFLLFILLFITEVLIAIFVHDRFVRPYVGDFLVVMLMYCFCKSFITIKVLPLAFAVLIFAYLVEILQYFKFGNRIGLGDVRLVQVVLGTSFEWTDMLAYTLGVVVIIAIEKLRRQPMQ